MRIATKSTSRRSEPLGTTIRFFLSSTFADFQVERDVLQERVFPELRHMCSQSGFRLQPIDLRWGVSEEAGNERQTLRICFDELERCRKISPDCFLVIQLGNRYGSHILPSELPANLVARLLRKLSRDERRTFEAAYQLDENAVPPEYVLRSAGGPERMEDEALRHVLARAGRAARLSDTERAPLEDSATHREVRLGLLDLPADHHRDAGVLCAVRVFGGQPNGPKLPYYFELDAVRATKVRRLTEAVTRRLPQQQIMRYEVEWHDDTGPIFDKELLAQQYLALLHPRIETVMRERTAAQEALAARGHDPSALANAAFEVQRAAHVVGREAELERLAAYLDGRSGKQFPLVMTGPAGSGKSTLLAEAAKRVLAAHPHMTLLTRYIGVTPGTSNLANLLTGLRREIAIAYGQAEPTPMTDLNQLITDFAEQLTALKVPAKRPLVLVLDALDQLSAMPQSVEWLPRTLPPRVRVLVSVLPDREEFARLAEQLPAEHVVTLGPLSRDAGRVVLHNLLATNDLHAHSHHPSPNPLQPRERTLTDKQEAAALDGFATSGLPLFLQVAAGEVRSWRSFDPAKPLPDSTDALVERILARLEQPGRHGPILVAHALGDLAAARDGLAEDELLDVLAQDDAVRVNIQTLSEHSPSIRENLPLPFVLWARLAAEVEQLLTEREIDGARLATFYHRVLREVVQRRYLNGEQGRARHQDLATYFERQQWELGSHVWNQRKLAELVSQQAEAEELGPLRQTLTDARYLQGKLSVSGANATLEDLAALVGDPVADHISWVVQRWAAFLEQHPEEVVNQIEGLRPSSTSWVLHHTPGDGRGAAFRFRFPTLHGDPSQLRRFECYTGKVTDCALSADGRRALAYVDHTTDQQIFAEASLLLWDTTTGKELHHFKLSWDKPRCCALSADGRLALSGHSYGGGLILWETASGDALWRFGGDRHSPSYCAFSANGRLAMSDSTDGSGLTLWDTSSGEELRRFATDYADSVSCCALSADGRLVLSGSYHSPSFDFGMLRLWDAASGEELHSFSGPSDRPYRFLAGALSADGDSALVAAVTRHDHEDNYLLSLGDTESWQWREIQSGNSGIWPCALSADGHVALSASDIGGLILWDTASGKELRRFAGDRSDPVSSCALSADGHLALSGSVNGELFLWDVAREPRLRHVDGHSGHVWKCSLSADGTLALSTDGGTMRLWDTNSGEELRTFEDRDSSADYCALSADGRRALSVDPERGILVLWDTASGEELRRLDWHYHLYDDEGDSIVCCALSGDGCLALFGTNKGTLALWDVARSEEVPSNGIGQTSTAVNVGGSYVLDWVVAGNNVVREFRSDGAGMCFCAFSADGRRALSSSYDSTLVLWDTSRWDISGKKLHTFKRGDLAVCCCALSADGLRALSPTHDHTLVLWDTTSGEELRTFEGHQDGVFCCALSADGRLAMSGSDDHTLRLWDIATGRQVALWQSEEPIYCCGLGPDGTRAVVGTDNGGFHFLEVVGIALAPHES